MKTSPQLPESKRSLPLLLFLLLALAFTQCRPQPRGVLGTEEMKDISRDLLLLSGSAPGANAETDSAYALTLQSVLDKYGITSAEYDSSLMWYAQNAQFLTKIYEELAIEFQEKGVQLDSAIIDSTRLYAVKYAPATSLWSGMPRFAISALRGIYYRYQSVTGVSPGDTLDFRMLVYPPLRGGQSIEVTFFIKDSVDVARHRETMLFNSGERVEASFVIPTSISGYTGRKTMSLLLKYSNPAASKADTALFRTFVTMDSIALYKRLPPPPPEMPQDSLSSSPTPIS